jgi:two-component system CheB/CheR fusion protein
MSRALVVDDCPDTTDSFCWLLRLWGYDARAANDGPAALALAAEFRPDVALVDLAMPGMDGRELARRLRRLPGLRRLLIVGTTGYAGGGGRPCPEGDFDLCLLKPVEPDELRRLLDGLAAPPEPRALLGVRGRARANRCGVPAGGAVPQGCR